MEEKKFDKNNLIAFLLIFLIFGWMMYNSQKDAEKEKLKQQKEALAKKENKKVDQKTATLPVATTVDSTTTIQNIEALKGTYGNFAYAASLPTAKDGFTTLENDVISLKISNKGGNIVEATLKKYEKFKKGSGELVKLIEKNNANFNLVLKTKDNKTLNTKDLYFEPTVSKSGENQVVSMRLKTDANAYLEYQYILKPNDYMMDFNITTQGLNQTLDAKNPVVLNWDLKAINTEKSVTYENQYSEIYFEDNDDKIDYVGQGNDKEETPESIKFIAYKQHFFTSILLSQKPLGTTKLYSNNLVKNNATDTLFTKQFKTEAPLAFSNNGELDYKMNMYYGPADYKMLTAYEKNLEKIIPLGWGIFGWINRLIFVPLFSLLGQFMPYGIAIILFTLIIKLAMSPITFKSFLSQAKMKVLRPEIQEINEKVKDPMKRQQETMALYNKAGVNPMAGCIPALIQMPFLIASFRFFPVAFELRQKSFLWADDLSSFDSIMKLPFNIPMYGGHVSLFPILAAIAIFIYMKMTSGDQQMAQPAQEGMPDMGKMMKIMIYVSPIMMLIFFNSYGAGLSLYNLVSNLVTIGLMIVIKRYFIDSDKIHAQIQENKAKPKTESKFQKKMREMMEQAEAQKKAQKK